MKIDPCLFQKGRPVDLEWIHVTMCVEAMVRLMRADGFQPNMIVGVARGGLIPAVMIANAMDVRRVRSFQLMSYIDGVQGAMQAIDDQNNLQFEMTAGFRQKVLFVEDIVDTGTSMKYLRDVFGAAAALADCDVRYASLTLKKHKADPENWPDYVGIAYEESAWVTFPWEPETVTKPLAF